MNGGTQLGRWAFGGVSAACWAEGAADEEGVMELGISSGIGGASETVITGSEGARAAAEGAVESEAESAEEPMTSELGRAGGVDPVEPRLARSMPPSVATAMPTLTPTAMSRFRWARRIGGFGIEIVFQVPNVSLGVVS